MTWLKISVPLFSERQSCSWGGTELSSGESVWFNYTTLLVAAAQTHLFIYCLFHSTTFAHFPVRFLLAHAIFIILVSFLLMFVPASSPHPWPLVTLFASFLLLPFLHINPKVTCVSVGDLHEQITYEWSFYLDSDLLATVVSHPLKLHRME